jgi:hypothetical protein
MCKMLVFRAWIGHGHGGRVTIRVTTIDELHQRVPIRVWLVLGEPH